MHLIDAKDGPHGKLRVYQHPRFGRLEVTTTWRTPGAEIIRISTERDQQKRRDALRLACEEMRHWDETADQQPKRRRKRSR